MNHENTSPNQMDMRAVRLLDTLGWMIRMSCIPTMDLKVLYAAWNGMAAEVGYSAEYHVSWIQYIEAQLTERFPSEYTDSVRSAVRELLRWSIPNKE